MPRRAALLFRLGGGVRGAARRHRSHRRRTPCALGKWLKSCRGRNRLRPRLWMFITIQYREGSSAPVHVLALVHVYEEDERLRRS